MTIKEWLKKNWIVIVVAIILGFLTITITWSLSSSIEYIKVHGLQSLWYGTGR